MTKLVTLEIGCIFEVPSEWKEKDILQHLYSLPHLPQKLSPYYIHYKGDYTQQDKEKDLSLWG